MSKLINTFYTVALGSAANVRIALLADFHNGEIQPVIDSLKAHKPDFIAFAGDAVNGVTIKFDRALELLRQASDIAPLFFCAGNHDLLPPTAFMEQAAKTGAVILSRSVQRFRGISIGAIPYDTEKKDGTSPENLRFLEEFSRLKTTKLLLCHVPSYYTMIKPYDIDIIVSGHAHGGQWRFFGRGIYAPHQGFFPKYTSGIHDGRLIISRGLGDSTRFPRINNPHEIIYIDI